MMTGWRRHQLTCEHALVLAQRNILDLQLRHPRFINRLFSQFQLRHIGRQARISKLRHQLLGITSVICRPPFQLPLSLPRQRSGILNILPCLRQLIRRSIQISQLQTLDKLTYRPRQFQTTRIITTPTCMYQ